VIATYRRSFDACTQLFKVRWPLETLYSTAAPLKAVLCPELQKGGTLGLIPALVHGKVDLFDILPHGTVVEATGMSIHIRIEKVAEEETQQRSEIGLLVNCASGTIDVAASGPW
jgi:hypothetical protein